MGRRNCWLDLAAPVSISHVRPVISNLAIGKLTKSPWWSTRKKLYKLKKAKKKHFTELFLFFFFSCLDQWFHFFIIGSINCISLYNTCTACPIECRVEMLTRQLVDMKRDQGMNRTTGGDIETSPRFGLLAVEPHPVSRVCVCGDLNERPPYLCGGYWGVL